MLTFKDYLIEKCNCWTGYKRKAGTKPCAPGSCVKEESETVQEGLADDILASAKAAGLKGKIAPPLADRKKATMKLLKHRAREAKRNPPPPREMPPRKTGFGSGAEDDTKGT